MTEFTKAMKKILKMVIKEKKILESNPKMLAKLMAEYDEIHYASRFHEDENKHDWNNPKYDVIDLENETTPEYASLVYDAWCAGLSGEDEDEEDGKRKSKKLQELEAKRNKTMEDYVEMCTAKDYRYNSIFPDRKRVLDHFLCVIGTGVKWNKDGFLADTGPSGEDMNLFHGYKTVELPEKILKQCTWLDNTEICKYREKMNETKRKEAAKKKAEAKKHKAMLKKMKDLMKMDDEAKKDYPFYPMSKEYSNLCTMPDNAHESYKAAGIEICNLILKNKEEEKNNKTIATQVLKKLTGGK